MRMIERIKQAMRDTGVCDGMNDEELDIAVTAGLEAMMEIPEHFDKKGYELTRYFREEFDRIITLTFEE